MGNDSRVDDKRLRDRLVEDLGSEAEADALLPVMLRLTQWQTARAAYARHGQIIAQLHQAADQRQRSHCLVWWLEWRPLLLLRAQIPVVQREIWLASTFLMALGAILTLLTAHLASGSLTFVLLAPVIAASGIASLYNDETERMMEIERTMPDSVAVILLARMVLVFGFDTLLGVAASLFIILLNPSLLLWSFVLSWLAPMALLSSLAFLISVLWRDSVAGILVSLSLWCAYHIWHLAASGFHLTAEHQLVAAGPYLMLAALVLAGLALWLVEHQERVLRIKNHVD